MEKPTEKEECRCEPTPVQTLLLRHIFESIMSFGTASTVREMSTSLNKSKEDVIQTLDELESKDLLLRRERTQEVISIYPFSLTPTEHQIFLEDGKRLFAMCAIDALGMPITFNRNVKIVSRCERCKQEIVVEIEDEEIALASHSSILIWRAEHKEGPQAETCCPLVNFFCSRKHLEEWKSENPDLAKTGHGVGLRKAFPGIKERWGSYGESMGIR